jgi:hypothetical protein
MHSVQNPSPLWHRAKDSAVGMMAPSQGRRKRDGQWLRSVLALSLALALFGQALTGGYCRAPDGVRRPLTAHRG